MALNTAFYLESTILHYSKDENKAKAVEQRNYFSFENNVHLAVTVALFLPVTYLCCFYCKAGTCSETILMVCLKLRIPAEPHATKVMVLPAGSQCLVFWTIKCNIFV